MPKIATAVSVPSRLYAVDLSPKVVSLINIDALYLSGDLSRVCATLKEIRVEGSQKAVLALAALIASKAEDGFDLSSPVRRACEAAALKIRTQVPVFKIPEDERVVAAKEGTKYTARRWIPLDRQFEQVVGSKCDKNAGVWSCITHDISFRNQIEKDSHISARYDHAHELVWICYEHGPEVP